MHRPPHMSHFRLVLVGMLLAMTLAALDQMIVSTALPSIASDLGSLNHLSWVVTSYLVTSTATAPLYGKLSDVYGRKPGFVVSITLFLVGSVACGLAPTMNLLIVFRALQGLGAGGLMTLAQTTIGDLVSPRERGRYQGLFAAVFTGCSVAGPLLGGVLTDALSWRWIFYVNLPVGLVGLALLVFGLPARTRRVEHRIDYEGAMLLTAATTAAVLVLSWGGNVYPWSSPEIIGLAGVGAALFGLLMIVERRAAEPILPPRLFTNSIFLISVICITLSTTALFGMVTFMPLLFQLLNHVTPTMAGLLVAPLTGGIIIASTAGGRLITRTGRYKILPVAGLAAASLGYLGIAKATTAILPLPVTEVLLVAVGLGTGMVMPTLTTVIQNAVQHSDLGVATAAATYFRSLGGALGTALTGAVLANRVDALGVSLHRGIHQSMADIASLPAELHGLVLAAYRAALSESFSTGAVIAGLAFALVMFLPEKPLQTRLAAAER